MNIIEKLPDDIILYIYTKCLKRYRMYEGRLIKLIDLDKYKFLEKYIYRRIKSLRMFHSPLLNDDDDGVVKYSIQYQLSNLSYANREEPHLPIEDDMLFIEVTVTNNLSIRYDVQSFRLKKIEDIRNINALDNEPARSPSIYYRGNRDDYDWEIVKYSYEI